LEKVILGLDVASGSEAARTMGTIGTVQKQDRARLKTAADAEFPGGLSRPYFKSQVFNLTGFFNLMG